MRKLPFNDEWILQNYHKFASYRELAEEHNKLFSTRFSRMQMKNHAGLILGARYDRYWYTAEMEEWIRREYPKPGTAAEKAKSFNETFGTKRSGQCIKEKARSMGVSLSEGGQADYKNKSGEFLSHYNKTVRAYPVGTVGRPSNGYPMIKTSEGWMLQSRYEYMRQHGEILPEHVVIYLNGDANNASKANLMSIPRKCQAIMTANKFWSEEPELTRTGAMWSELYSVCRFIKE